MEKKSEQKIPSFIERDAVIEQVEKAVDQRMEHYVEILAVRLSGAVLSSQPAESQEVIPWLEIDSLSKLRSVVGGRFQNLRDRWLSAGFPLREHRGDQPEEWEVKMEGWLELSAWIFKQGYESRLVDKEGSVMFEVRTIGS